MEKPRKNGTEQRLFCVPRVSSFPVSMARPVLRDPVIPRDDGRAISASFRAPPLFRATHQRASIPPNSPFSFRESTPRPAVPLLPIADDPSPITANEEEEETITTATRVPPPYDRLSAIPFTAVRVLPTTVVRHSVNHSEVQPPGACTPQALKEEEEEEQRLVVPMVVEEPKRTWDVS